MDIYDIITVDLGSRFSLQHKHFGVSWVFYITKIIIYINCDNMQFL